MVQNSLGEVMAVQSEKIKKPSSDEILEMLAVRRVVQFVKEIGLNHSCFEGDSEIVVKALRGGDMFHLLLVIYLETTSMWSYSLSHLVKQGNVVAHFLAQRTRHSFLLDGVYSILYK